MADQKVMKDIGINDQITVTVQAYVWIGLMASYGNCDWNDTNLNMILRKVQHEIMDPIWINEREAETQEQLDQQNSLLHHFVGRIPGLGEERPGDEPI